MSFSGRALCHAKTSSSYHIEELQEYFAGALRRIDNGMKLSFIVCVISAKDSVLETRINERRGPDTRAQHFEVFKTPVHG